MATRVQIDCVLKDDRLGPYERIQRVGGPNTSGSSAPDTSKLAAELRRRGLTIADRPRWELSLDEAIQGVLDETWNFCVQLDMHDIVNVSVAKSPAGQLYLKTEADQDTPDHLLCLPQCR